MYSAGVFIIASVKHGLSHCSLLHTINSVMVKLAAYIGHRNQTEEFILINDSKILHKAPFRMFVIHTSIISLHKMKTTYYPTFFTN